jgi:hypothetical protein
MARLRRFDKSISVERESFREEQQRARDDAGSGAGGGAIWTLRSKSVLINAAA